MGSNRSSAARRLPGWDAETIRERVTVGEDGTRILIFGEPLGERVIRALSEPTIRDFAREIEDRLDNNIF